MDSIKNTLKMLSPSIQEVHKKFCEFNNKPYDPTKIIKDLSWNCSGSAHAVALLIPVDGKIIKSVREIYGMFYGLSVQYKRVGFYRHAWVLVNEKYIIDPNRWVFHAKIPKMYICEKTNRVDYDQNMVRFRSQFPRVFPPSENNTSNLVNLNWSKDLVELLQTLSLQSNHDFKTMYMNQVMWMANLPPAVLGNLQAEVYTTLTSMNMSGFIPVDYRKQFEFEQTEVAKSLK